jgi:hypothetical protein
MYRTSCPYSLAWVIYSKNPSKSEALSEFSKHSYFLWGEAVSHMPNPQAGDHPLSAVRGCLFNVSAATLQSWWLFPPPATWGRTTLWWQGTHLIWAVTITIVIWTQTETNSPTNSSTNSVICYQHLLWRAILEECVLALVYFNYFHTNMLNEREISDWRVNGWWWW